MKTTQEAAALARALVDTANGAGCKTAALVTDMNTPLAPALGNAVEIAVCMEVLSGNTAAAPRLYDLSVALGARVLALHGEDEDKALARMKTAISSGEALTRFADMVLALGGPPDMADDWRTQLPAANVVGEVPAPTDGYPAAKNGEALGLAVVALGGGRQIETDRINPSVGFSDMVSVGDKVVAGQPLCTVHAATEDTAEAAAHAVLKAISIGDAPEATPLIIERINP
jgi:thymidine phosphorylase